MIEFFLWLLLIYRVCLKLAPYVLGLAGAAVLARYISPGIPPKYIAGLFVMTAIGLIAGLKGVLSDTHDDSTNRNARHHNMF